MGVATRPGRVSGYAIVAMKEKVRGQTKKEKEVVSNLQSAEVAVLFNSARQFHTLNKKFLDDMEARLSQSVQSFEAAVHMLHAPAVVGGDRASLRLRGSVASHGAPAPLEWLVEGPGAVSVGDLLEQFASLCLIYTQYAASYAGALWCASIPTRASFCGVWSCVSFVTLLLALYDCLAAPHCHRCGRCQRRCCA